MRQNIHPSYEQQKFVCSCGQETTVGTTLGEDMRVEVCSACHPFYTGKQKIVDTAGRVEKHKKRFGSFAAVAAKNDDSKE